MKTKVEVKKIEINIGKQKIELTLDEARELRDLLNDTFGEQKTIYVPGAPVIIERPYYPYRYWTVTCEPASTSAATAPQSSTTVVYSLANQAAG